MHYVMLRYAERPGQNARKSQDKMIDQHAMISRLNLSLWLVAMMGSVGVAPLAQAQETGTLTIEVEGLENQDGNVCLKLFAGSEGFPNDDEDALQRACVPIVPLADAEPSSPESGLDSSGSESSASESTGADPSFRYTFENLPYGNYAVAIYHDDNGDERLNRGIFGIPAEGYGFSNDAPVSFGPPDFEDAVFVLDGTDLTIQIEMRYR